MAELRTGMIFDPIQQVSLVPQVKEFFLARQPILDRNQNLVGYELLFRRVGTRPGNAVEDLRGAASIIAHTSELGMKSVMGNAAGFFNVDYATLMSDIVSFLPCEKVVFEIPQTIKITAELIRRISDMVGAGYKFALDDVIIFSDYIRPLLPLIEFVKVDTSVMTRADLSTLTSQFKEANKLLVAEKVETIEQFRNCAELGFDYFQGYYFAKPVILSGKKLTSSQAAILQLMALVVRDAENAVIEHRIKKEASLFLSLLRLVNTPAMGVAKNINSISEALLVLGRRQLRQWLQIQLYMGPDTDPASASPLLLLATTRGKFLELAARKLKPANKSIADTAFTVGTMSLLDTLFSQPMTTILEQIILGKEVREALLHRTGFYGDLLKLSEYVEKPGEASQLLPPLLLELNLPSESLYALQLEAFEWSNSLLPSYREA
ncbi:EAL and modified HD-GYP domain-containing signal transduction protein [Nitrosospira sp. Nsp2]|uniref:EAL and HDOD domain-containing protein n=1 Tax=Nitrosospira sp. Nsp2 TaxID=136548 RepID=UPI000D407C6A|nr:EAL domain-containing protein [Nitrosospira sp. Nsp2]PTR16423.1 EAL and modified HD-GYP domain-containing signal transduction protein [Nitrosospira sp. Nsp2]